MFNLAIILLISLVWGFCLSVCPSVISQRLLRGLYMRFGWLDGVYLVPVFTHSFFSFFGFVASGD